MILDKYSSQFLSKGNVFLMDLAISILVSIAVAVVAFLFEVKVVSDVTFDYCWGLSAGLGSGVMFLLLKTHTIIIRHFSFKDTVLFGLAALGKVAVMAVALLALGLMASPVIPMLLLPGYYGVSDSIDYAPRSDEYIYVDAIHAK